MTADVIFWVTHCNGLHCVNAVCFEFSHIWIVVTDNKSHAITKITARCALYMSVLKIVCKRKIS